MSLVILATKGSNIEQFGRFIDHLESAISNYNSSLESEGQEVSGNPIDQNSFVTKARELLNADDLYVLLKHTLSLENLLIAEPRGIE